MRCRNCAGDRLELVFEMDPMPLAGAFADSKEQAVAAEKYALSWLWCADCGLVNVAPDIPDEILFSTYHYASSDVPAVVRHFTGYASFLAERFTDPVRIVEIGSNDGVLLNHLPEEWDKIGVDPSDIGHPTIRAAFSSEVARQIGTADVVTSSNTMAHFTAIGDAWRGIELLKPKEVWIEVHDLDATLESGQWDTVYHEHKVEWSVHSLSRAAAVHGFEVIWLNRLALHGGLLRIGFKPSRERPAPPVRQDFSGLVNAYLRRRETFAYRSVMADWAAAYGAAGRGTVYLNQIPELPIRYVVDDSPQRAGRWVPGVGLPIVSSLADPPMVLVTAWNHAADIAARHPEYSGRWLTAW